VSACKAWALIMNQAPSIYERYFPGLITHNALKDAIDQTMLLLALEECVMLM